MRQLVRNIAVARTVSRRQLLSRGKKLLRRRLYRVRVSFLGPARLPTGVDGLLVREASQVVSAAGGILAHLRTRAGPRWFPGPDIADAEPDSFPEEAAESLATAERVLSGTYRFLNVDAPRSEHPPDWAGGPHAGKEWTYLLNRFHYLLDVSRAYRYTHREEFVRLGMELIDDWLERNPEGHPTTWESVSCAWRIENWFAALLHFLPSETLTEAWTARLLASIARHAEHLRRHIEYDLAGNHLLFEAKGLIVAGLMLPEMRSAAVWFQDGMELLRREVSRQVLPDGGHGELAIHYHVEVTLLLTEIAVLLKINGHGVPPDIATVLKRMYRFLLWVTRPDGHIPMFGDSVRDDPVVASRLLGMGFVYLGETPLSLLARGGAQVDRLLGPGASDRIRAARSCYARAGARVFPVSGYVVARNGWSVKSDYFMWDCGPFGMRAGPGHGHADPLSFELVLGGATVVMDPGVYQYEGGPWRDYFRGIAAHNTVRVDGRNPCLMWSAYRVMHPPRTRLLGWVALPGLHVGEAEHDGYRRDAGITHRRAVVWLHEQTWLIADWLHPPDRDLSWEAFLHLAPGADLTCDGRHFQAVIDGSGPVEGQFLGGGESCAAALGQTEPIQGWVSYAFGQKQEAPVLVVSGRLAAAPLVTVLGRAGGTGRWTLDGAGEGAVVLRREAGRNVTLVGLRGPLSPRLRSGEVDTDGRAVVCELREGALTRVALVGGRYMSWAGSPLFQARATADFIQWSTDGDAQTLLASTGTQVRLAGEGSSHAGDGHPAAERGAVFRSEGGGGGRPSRRGM